MVGILIGKVEDKFKVEAASGCIKLGNLVLEIVLVTFSLSHVCITKISHVINFKCFY